jgi:hypothetical protein
MTKSYHFTIELFMVRNSNGAFFTLRDVPTIIANHPWGVAFFIHDNSDFFSLFEVGSDGLIGQFGKVMVQFFGHIY